MQRSQINPLAAEENDFVAASTAELSDLANLVSYVSELEGTNKMLRQHTHENFIRAVYLAADSRDRATFQAVANGT